MDVQVYDQVTEASGEGLSTANSFATPTRTTMNTPCHPQLGGGTASHSTCTVGCTWWHVTRGKADSIIGCCSWLLLFSWFHSSSCDGRQGDRAGGIWLGPQHWGVSVHPLHLRWHTGYNAIDSTLISAQEPISDRPPMSGPQGNLSVLCNLLPSLGQARKPLQYVGKGLLPVPAKLADAGNL